MPQKVSKQAYAEWDDVINPIITIAMNLSTRKILILSKRFE